MIAQNAEGRAPGTGAKRRPRDQALVTAAVLLNEQMPDADIAAAFGVSRRTLNRWKRLEAPALEAGRQGELRQVLTAAGPCIRRHQEGPPAP